MSKQTADPATFERQGRSVSIIIEDTAAEATVSAGFSDSAGGIEYRVLGTLTGVDVYSIPDDMAYSHIKVAGQGGAKWVICSGGTPA